jgi:hypothetical protein
MVVRLEPGTFPLSEMAAMKSLAELCIVQVNSRANAPVPWRRSWAERPGLGQSHKPPYMRGPGEAEQKGAGGRSQLVSAINVSPNAGATVLDTRGSLDGHTVETGPNAADNPPAAASLPTFGPNSRCTDRGQSLPAKPFYSRYQDRPPPTQQDGYIPVAPSWL